MTSQKEADRRKLEQDLSSLLEYEVDEISDILDNLLQSFSVDTTTKDELVEHLTAWLGDDGGNGMMEAFVDNVIRFQKGERLSSTSSESNSSSAASSAAATTANAYTTSSNNINNGTATNKRYSAKSKKQKERAQKEERQREIQRQREEERKQQKQLEQKQQEEEAERLRLGQEKALLIQQKQQRQMEKEEEQRRQREKEEEKKQRDDEWEMMEQVKAMSLKESSNHQPTSKKSSKGSKKQQSTSTTKKPAPPLKGKAKIICGCLGTKHKALTNCLNCGYILCAKEGYGYCPFCNYLVEEITISEEELLLDLATLARGGSNNGEVNAEDREAVKRAIVNKKRLLQFDSEHTKRTVVYDDQADYYQKSSSNWLSGEERADAKAMEEKRSDDLHKRKNQVLKVNF